jgi:hypothetical protein
VQDSRERNLADDWNLQLPCKVGIDHRSGRSRVQQKVERARAIDHRLDDDQVSRPQMKLKYFVWLHDLRCQHSRQSKKGHESKTSDREMTSKEAATSIEQQAGRQHTGFPRRLQAQISWALTVASILALSCDIVYRKVIHPAQTRKPRPSRIVSCRTGANKDG